MRRLAQEEFEAVANKIHEGKYDYSKVKYVNSNTKICIICPQHGEFWQTPTHHIHRGQGCPKCAGRHKTTKDVIDECKQVHGNRYDYSKAEYKGVHKKLCIICSKHGEFWQTPANHIVNHEGCPLCKLEYLNKCFADTTDSFIEKAHNLHGDKYDYSNVKYTNNQTNVCIVCHKKDKNGNEHGEFWQLPATHLRGGGCPQCNKERMHLLFAKTSEQFINEAIKIHGLKYDYSKVDYKNSETNVCIICSKHGEFWQNPVSHLQGRGCRLCNESHLEAEIDNAFSNIDRIRNKRFTWLGYKSLDFYFPQYNVAIECQGVQHFKKIKFFENEQDPFEIRNERDKMKLDLCKSHGVTLYYFSHENVETFLGETVYHNVGDLKKKILNSD